MTAAERAEVEANPVWLNIANASPIAAMSKMRTGPTAGSATAFTMAAPGYVLEDGAMVQFRLHTAPATNATLNVNGTGAKPIISQQNRPLMAVTSNMWVSAIYGASKGAYIIQGDGSDNYWGTTAGTATALTLNSSVSLVAGDVIRFRTNVALTLPTTLKVGSMTARTLAFPFRGREAIPSGAYIGAVYIGTGGYLVFEDSTMTRTSQDLTWFDLPTVLGNWTLAPKYTKVNGMVFVTGRVRTTDSTNALYATLPTGHRPGRSFFVQGYSNGGNHMDVGAEIRTDGGIWTYSANGWTTSTTFSVMFPAEN